MSKCLGVQEQPECDGEQRSPIPKWSNCGQHFRSRPRKITIYQLWGDTQLVNCVSYKRLWGACSEVECTLVHKDGTNPAFRHTGKQEVSELEL